MGRSASRRDLEPARRDPTVVIHVVAYLRRAPQLAIADVRDGSRGRVARRSLIVGSVLFGAALVVAMLPFSSPFALLLDSV